MFVLKHPFNHTVEEFVVTQNHGVLRIVNHPDHRLYVRYDVWEEEKDLTLYHCVNDNDVLSFFIPRDIRLYPRYYP